MTDNEMFVLALTLKNGGRVSYKEVFEAMHGEVAQRTLASLRDQGALDHVKYNCWDLTEKGRIALALAMHKDPKLAKAFT